METNAIQNRYEFVMLFDCENGNPNGDPDAGNMPRTDPETNFGIVTDVCLKRKIRNFVELYKEGEPGYNILIKADKALNSKFAEAYENLHITLEERGKKKGKETPLEVQKKAQQYICQNYYDVRTFGAVMQTGDDWCGTVRGPVQINFARSIDPVYVQDISITRKAVTKVEDFKVKQNEIGNKSIIPYGLYRAEGYVSAMQAQKVTGFSEDDLELLWTAILHMFDEDHSAARGKMCMRALYVFKHESPLGNAPSHVLFDKIQVKKKDSGLPARAFSDYEIIIDETMPEGVTLVQK